MTALGLARRHLDRKTPWRLVKKYCAAAGIDPSRLGSREKGPVNPLAAVPKIRAAERAGSEWNRSKGEHP